MFKRAAPCSVCSIIVLPCLIKRASRAVFPTHCLFLCNLFVGDSVMSKLLTLSLMTVLLGTSAAAAEAGCNSSCAMACQPTCAAATPQDMAQMQQTTARAPQATRSFSYQPSPTGTYRAMPRSRGRNSFGPRGATSKLLGNY